MMKRAALLSLFVLGAPAWSGPRESPAGKFTIVGRVVDESRVRIAGAHVRLKGWGGPDASAAETTADERGRYRFEIEVADLAEAAWNPWAVVAEHEGRWGFESTPTTTTGVTFVSPIVVRPGTPVPVRVPDVSGPVRVRAWARLPQVVLVAEEDTDAQGRAVLRNLPQTHVWIEAEGVEAELTPDQMAAPVSEVTLGPRRLVPVVVRVTGVPPEARERTWIEVEDPNRYGRPVEKFPLGLAAAGPLDVPPGAEITVFTSGPTRARGASWGVDLPPGAGRVDIEVQQPVPVQWPVTAGTAPVPPEGTVLRILQVPGHNQAAFPKTARIEQGRIAVEAVGPEHEGVWAFAPDGSAAWMVMSPYRWEPVPTKFRRGRTIHVRLREADGRPVVGAHVGVWWETLRPPILHAPTDAEGRTRIVTYEEDAIGLTLTEGGHSWRTFAQVEPGGDVTVDATLPPKVPVVLRVTLDGRPGLPARYHLSALGQDIDDAEEDAGRGEIRFEARPPFAGRPVDLSFGAAGWVPEEGFQPLPGRVADGDESPVARRTARPGEPLALPLRRAGRLRVELAGAPADAKKSGRRVVLEMKDGDRWTTVNTAGYYDRLSIHPKAPLLLTLDHGTWRVRDHATGRTTDPVVVPGTGKVVVRTLTIGP